MALPVKFSPQFTITSADDDQVAVTVLLPPDLATDYCHFLESLAAFFFSVRHRSRYQLAADRVATGEFRARAAQATADYRALLVSLFDKHTAAGADRKAAVKLVAADLRARKHPWSSVELVRSELVAAGRGGQTGRPRRVRS